MESKTCFKWKLFVEKFENLSYLMIKFSFIKVIRFLLRKNKTWNGYFELGFKTEIERKFKYPKFTWISKYKGISAQGMQL